MPFTGGKSVSFRRPDELTRKWAVFALSRGTRSDPAPILLSLRGSNRDIVDKAFDLASVTVVLTFGSCGVIAAFTSSGLIDTANRHGHEATFGGFVVKQNAHGGSFLSGLQSLPKPGAVLLVADAKQMPFGSDVNFPARDGGRGEHGFAEFVGVHDLGCP